MPLATFLQKSPMIVLATIITLLAYQLALLTWSVLPAEKPALLWQATAANTTKNSNEINTLKLQEQHLFGEKAKKVKPVVKEVSIGNAPKTRLNLKLVGVVASTEPEYSSAIIDQKGRQSSYFINSEIDGTSATIIKIYQDRIILKVNGSHQTLMLDGVETLDKQHQRQEVKSTQQKKPVSKASEIRTVKLDRQALLKNPGKLTDYIRISPVRQNGKVKGYRVKPGKDRSLFEQAGLKSGDLAVELNGIDLTDMQQAFTLMKEFPTMTDMTLTVERAGQLHELYFSIPQ